LQKPFEIRTDVGSLEARKGKERKGKGRKGKEGSMSPPTFVAFCSIRLNPEAGAGF
jgi:hypothetical protein